MELGEMISVYRKQAGLTIDELAAKSGVPKGTINKIIGGITKAPTLDNIKAIARALNLRLADFDDGPQPAEFFTASEQEIIKRYRALDKHGKDIVDSTLNLEYQRIEQAAQAAQLSPVSESPPEEDNIIPIPLSWSKASAGEGFYLFEGPDEELKVIYNNYTRKADFCVRVTGHSMEPKIYDGDIILIRKQPAVDVHEIGLYIVNDCGYVKKQGADRLISINPEYDDVFPNEFDYFRCCGKFVGVLDPDWIVEE